MRRVRGLSAALALLLAVLALCPQMVSTRAEAADGLAVECRVCEFDKDAKYEYTSATSVPQSMVGGDVMGKLFLEGDVRQNGVRDSYPIYEVQSGNLSFRYSFEESALARDISEWNVISDDGRKVDSIDLGAKIGNGALILQASLDGEKWLTECKLTDVFKADSKLAEPFYSTSDIQLQNGCYFRVALAYKQRRKSGRTQFLFFQEHNEYEERKFIELYSFYAISSEVTGKVTTAADTPRRELGRKIKVEKDSGYANQIAIKSDDPHYGWDIGSFIINGYTRETSANGTPVFLKTLGDKVTLWFHLNEDIDHLNGSDNLSIARDKKGSDEGLEIKPTDFGRGALFIRFTDHEGVVHEPVMYLNYLEACARTGADTRVQLFEEGDYEVALDYKIMKDGVGLLDDYSDYRIYFRFSIRNGNCMVFPFDVDTGNELVNGAVTPNGFKLDMAKSRYLTIDVKRSMPVMQPDGTLAEDVRFNRPARDGETYRDEGIYTFTVRNKYTGESTVKTIYVGVDRYVNAMSRNGLTVAELNSAIGRGATVAEDGEIIEPVVVTQPPQTEKPTPTPTIQPTATPEPEPEPTATIPGMVVPIVIVIVVVLLAAVVLICIRRRKGGNEQ